MSKLHQVSPDIVRSRFSNAMSEMYGREVPQYNLLQRLVADINDRVLDEQPRLRGILSAAGELQRIHVERHGAIRLGSAVELSNARRVFAVMGMRPVGYYDLSVAGIPVHATAFRPVTEAALTANPFRVFTSLLRLEAIEDEGLRKHASRILERRQIFSSRALELTARHEADCGLSEVDADQFVDEVLETFRWSGRATVSKDIYSRLSSVHRLIADVVCFKGPHINHLTPRTLDIEAVHAAMPKHGIARKEVIEGPPKRHNPILLRQTSFKALVERVQFPHLSAEGEHAARFGEIEQRGMALTRKGRALYDRLLNVAREAAKVSGNYEQCLRDAFEQFPDDLDIIRRLGLAYFKYSFVPGKEYRPESQDLDALIHYGVVKFEPIIYEDFLPVSAAGIFLSNLGDFRGSDGVAGAAKDAFERDLGTSVLDEFDLYEAAQQRSIDAVLAAGHGSSG